MANTIAQILKRARRNAAEGKPFRLRYLHQITSPIGVQMRLECDSQGPGRGHTVKLNASHVVAFMRSVGRDMEGKVWHF